MNSCSLILRGGNVVTPGSRRPQRLDIVIGADGRIAQICPEAPSAPAVREIDLAGRLVTPGLVDAHQHLDKSRTRTAVANPEGTLEGAIAGFAAYAAGMTREDVMARAERTIDACVERGTVALRSHADVKVDIGCSGVEALAELRTRCAGRIQLQVVAFLTEYVLGPRVTQAFEDAIAVGADVIGGAPAIAGDTEAYLDLLFAAAVRHGLPLDLHLDEHLDAGRQHFDKVIERTRANGLQGRVVASHACVLSAMAPSEADRVIEGLVEAGIGVITLPAANLFLQGRASDALPPRGTTRIRELIAAGVPVAAASDNIQDPFIPIGSGDLLEIARWTLVAGHLGAEDIATAFDMVTAAPARLMALGDGYGLHEGARADLLITDAQDAEDLVVSGPLERAVLSGGQVVAGAL